jgi:hypothetical protein
MHLTRDGRFERTDIWREGKWVDLWSVVHLLSGASMAFIIYRLPFNTVASVVIALLSLTAYEMWEMIVQIQETPMNRFMDIVVGMVSFLPVYFLLAPRFSTTLYILVFGFVLTANIVMSVFGWIASQKAAMLEAHLRERYEKKRLQRLERKMLKEKLRAGDDTNTRV